MAKACKVEEEVLEVAVKERFKEAGEPDGVKFVRGDSVKFAPSEWMVKVLENDGWVKA